jgi:hypothetical protein
VRGDLEEANQSGWSGMLDVWFGRSARGGTLEELEAMVRGVRSCITEQLSSDGLIPLG